MDRNRTHRAGGVSLWSYSHSLQVPVVPLVRKPHASLKRRQSHRGSKGPFTLSDCESKTLGITNVIAKWYWSVIGPAVLKTDGRTWLMPSNLSEFWGASHTGEIACHLLCAPRHPLACCVPPDALITCVPHHTHGAVGLKAGTLACRDFLPFVSCKDTW